MTDFVEEQIKEFDKKFTYTDEDGNVFLLGGYDKDKNANTDNIPEMKAWIRSFASTLIERVGSELIGEDEPVSIESVETVDGTYDVTEDLSISRNNFRASQRTKLQEMR